jgi:hypothetical protein
MVISEMVLAPEPCRLQNDVSYPLQIALFVELPRTSARFGRLRPAILPPESDKTAQYPYSAQSDCIPKRRGRNQPGLEQDGKLIAVAGDLYAA